jgi:two-component system, sporulation sensor kinase D
MSLKLQIFLISSFSLIILSSFVVSGITINKIKYEIKNYSYVLSNALSSALILGSENVENIIKNIPFGIIITDQNDSIKFFRNFKSHENLNKIKEKLRKKNQYAEIIYEDFKIGRVYYDEPKSIFYLSVLPYILMIIAITTLIIIIIALRNAQKYEEEKFYSTFAKGLAHQMGNPLSSLIANFELLKKGEDRFFDIENDLNKLSSILKRFSKIGSSITLKPIQLKDTILGAYNNLKGKFQNELNLTINGDCLIYGDSELLEWVFENFLKNSYEANSKNVRIEITSEKKFHIIDIIDDGNGINPSIKDKLFSENITTKEKGWGIGLILSKRIIEMHKGKVKLIESKKGFTKFRILFPLKFYYE